MAVAPALLALGWINEDWNQRITVGLSIALTALSSAISIFANGQQQKVAAVETVLGIEPMGDPGTIPDVGAPRREGNPPADDPDAGIH
jgi:hypothetical protein